MGRITKHWMKKAEFLSNYARDPYNEERALLATLGSAGILTFQNDLENIVSALEKIGDTTLAELIKNKDWMHPCGVKL